MSGAQIAALIAAGAFALLVILLAVPVLKLGRTLDEATLAIRQVHKDIDPILLNANSTVEALNGQLERVDGIAQNAQAVSSNAAAVASVFASTVGGPLVKVAAMSYGIRHAAANRRKASAERAMKAERRSRRRHGARS
ncbi:MAG: DUF948 domain-containing protein [Mycobacteriales bacterium]|nr:MAG: DUF948 domain-containing protein [Pseudonocardiales bacterium]